MATKVRGITVEIGGDTSGLQKSLSSVNSEISSTQKQLKDVEKLLKLDPTNTELLTQKQQLLNQKMTETKTKLDTLKQAQDEFVANGGDKASEGYMALQREIIATEDQLKSATKEVNSFNANMEKASTTASAISSKAGEIAKKTKALSTAGAGVVGALATLGYKAMTTSDDLNTLAKQSGLTTEELQKFSYASDVIDVSTDDIVSALKKMRKNMDSTSTDVKEAWDTLGVSVKDTNGEFKDSTEVFYETLQALSNIENETQRDIISMQLFGKNADSLAGIIDDGGEALRTMGDEASRLGLILDQETLDELNAVNDQVDTLKAQLSQEFLQLGATTLQALTPIIEIVIDKLRIVAEWLGSLNEHQIKVILTIATLIASISPIASIVSKISGAISAMIPILTTLFTSATGWIGLVVAGIAMLVTVIVNNWDTIKGAIQTAWNWIKTTFNTIKDFIYNNIIKPIGNYFIGIVNTWISAINLLIRGLNKIKINLPSWSILGNLSGKSFGVNIKEIGTIPMLANGGVVTSGSAIVGEAGAELLSVANGKAYVQPLNQNAITSGIVNGLTPFMNNNQIIVVQSVLDGKVVAESIYNPFKTLERNRKVMTYGY